MEKIRYTLENLDCAGCAAKAEAAVNKAPWIEKATIDFMNKRLTVVLNEINPNATQDIQELVDSVLVGVNVVEYTGDETKSAKKTHKHDHDDCDCGCCDDDDDDDEHAHGHDHEHGGEERSPLMIATTVIAVAALAIGLGMKLFSFNGAEIVSSAAFCIAILCAGYDVIINGIKSIFKLRLDETALMAIAMVAAAILGEFFEGAMVAILYRIGEWLEDAAVDNSRESIEKLAEIRPDTANVKRESGVQVIRAEEVEIGETILIRPHERVPLDCVVIEGTSSVDSSALTGESVPITAEPDTQLLSGMMNGDGSLTAMVTNNYENSAAARIISLVTESAENKGNAEKFVTRFAVVYTPVVVGLAFLVAVIPPILGMGSFHDFIYRALTFLVASCPCAIVISVPLAFFSAIGGASKFGVLVKGGNFAEMLANARAVAFDKTGTVTTGKPTVSGIKAEEGFTVEQVAEMAAAAEVNSTHPYASAIKAYAGEADYSKYTNYSEISGHGVCCENAEGKQILCGGGKLLRKYGIEAPEGQKAQAYVTCDGRLAGRIFISDKAADGAAEVIGDLKKLGFESVAMLTGDGYDAAKQVADSVGITEFHAELLPENKVEKVNELKENTGITAFVGDGINDAPVLAAADVGIAMGLGSGAAIEAADIVLSSNNLDALPRSVKHFRKAMGIIKFNIAFAIVIKVIVLLLATVGYAPMWLAVLSDVGVCLLCIANSSRLINVKK